MTPSDLWDLLQDIAPHLPIGQPLLIERVETLLDGGAKSLVTVEDNAETLHAIVEHAAEHLPECWTIKIELENGYGGVTLENPHGDDVPDNDVFSCDDNLAEQIKQCVEYAKLNDGNFEYD